MASELPLQPTEVAGTLANRAVFIKESGLGEEAGLGLFAGREFAVGDRITSYEGPIRSREEIDAFDLDRSYADGPLTTSDDNQETHADPNSPFFSRYVLRLPLSGEQLMDGRPFADAIHGNPDNPGGRYLR